LELSSARLVPVPGSDGWLVRLPEVVLWAPGGGEGLDELASVCATEDGPAELLGQVGSRLADPEGTPWPPFALVVARSPDLVAVVHGPVELVVDDEGGETVLSGGERVGSWLNRVLVGAGSLRCGAPSADLGLANLRDGVVRANGFLLTGSAVPGTAGEVQTEVPVLAPPDDITVMGQTMAPHEHGASGRSLGTLTWDNGETDQLAAAVLIGREVNLDASVVAGELVPLVPGGPSDSMSRVHAELGWSGQDVVIVDRGSTNGTFVWDDKTNAWQRLVPGEAQVLGQRAMLAFGERTAVFDPPGAPTT